MRVLQLIDSLEAGGAERMAVTIANSLHNQISFSGLATTRAEGILANQIDSNVPYLHLNRKKFFDKKAIKKALDFIKVNEVSIIHAHSSSVFFALMLKIFLPEIQLIWHDHYGKSEELNKRPKFQLQFASLFVKQIFAVNENLVSWSQKYLFCKKITFLPNFISEVSNASSQIVLPGITGKRIVHLANLRPQKDHFLLLQIAKMCVENDKEITFHLVGKDFNDSYSIAIKQFIQSNNLSSNVFVYGTREDIYSLLNQATIGVLSSSSEGLPVALLEYGFCKLPVISTDVGDISKVITHQQNGILINDNEATTFYHAIMNLVENQILQRTFGNKLHQVILNQYSKAAFLKKYLTVLHEF